MPYADPQKQRDWLKRKMRERRANGQAKPKVQLVSLDDASFAIGEQITRAWTNAGFAVDGIGLG